MPYPIDPSTLNSYLTDIQSINAIAEAEAGIISTLSQQLYLRNSDNRFSQPGTFIFNLLSLIDNGVAIQDVLTLLKQLLCSYAMKEEAIADIINSAACKLALDKGLFQGEECCPCFKRICENK